MRVQFKYVNRFSSFVFLVLALSLLSLPVFSQESASPHLETGFIINGHTRLPVEGAIIKLYPGLQVLTSDEQGRFSFINTSGNKKDSMAISAIGHEKKRISYADFLSLNHVVELNTVVIELSEVAITLKPGFQNQVISQIDIQTRTVTNSQEVLRLVPGLFIGQHAGGGKAEQLFLRGFDIDHGTDINITVDGMPVNMVSHAHGQGYADLHFLIPELIGNVSFEKGPYHADKGNMATAGYVDFRTKKILPDNMIKLEAGRFNTYRAVGMMNLLPENAEEKGHHAYLASEYMYSNGYFDNPQDFNRLNLFGKYYGKMGKHNYMSVSASAFSSKWKASGQIPERALQSGLIGYFGAIDPNEGGNTHRTNINMQLQTNLLNGDQIKNQVFYTQYDFELYSNFTFFLKNNLHGDQVRQKEKRDLFGYHGSYSHSTYWGNKKLTNDAGISFRFDKTRDSELSRTKNRAELIEPLKLGDIQELNSGIWINETLQWNEKLSINAGIRMDHFNAGYQDKLFNNILNKASGVIVSPKLNFYYQLNKKTQLFLTTGKGFHSNDSRVVVQNAGKEIAPAAYGADLGIMLKPVSNLLVQSAVWVLRSEQEFIYVGDEGIIEPSGRSGRAGIDISMRYQPVKWLFIDADANYSRGRAIDEKKGSDYLPLAPVFTSIGGISYKSSKGLNAGLRYRYMSDRPANADYSLVAKGYLVTDGMISYTRKKVEVGLSVQNLFDVRWKETQFDTESRLQNETAAVSEIHFTPGTPFFLKTQISFFF